mmetsp:Transcript_16602/g.19699  ORF Transcript_16602/g.19699 Transcript_16602/m.19699 type:complete len:199 (-) Transcript_16602:82-678(-)
MSADGTTIVIGALTNRSRSGHLRVCDFGSNDQIWVKRSNAVDIETVNDSSVTDVSMSTDGSIVGINVFNTNTLRIFQWSLCSSPPTSMPTISPRCADGENPLRLDVVTDRFPKQTTWQVNNLANQTVLNGGPDKKVFSAYQEAHCLDKGSCYQFMIKDFTSDAICCSWFSGNGSYTLYFDSTLVLEGGSFSAGESEAF